MIDVTKYVEAVRGAEQTAVAAEKEFRTLDNLADAARRRSIDARRKLERAQQIAVRAAPRRNAGGTRRS